MLQAARYLATVAATVLALAIWDASPDPKIENNEAPASGIDWKLAPFMMPPGVIEWGTTKADAVRFALEHAPAVHAKMIGAVLNKVDFMSIGRYQPYGYGHYYGAGSYLKH